MKTVADIMTPEVLTVSPETPLKQAALEMVLAGVHGAPVKNENGQIIGLLSTTDLVAQRGPQSIGSPPRSLQTVGDAMTPILFAVLGTDHAMYAAKRMVETGSHRLVVLDDHGKLVGMITPMDVMAALVRGDDLHAGWEGWEERAERHAPVPPR
jgi:CBS domain-containing membrane protein